MDIKIYRGTHQIGGCVTEITSGSTRIFIDFGSELPGPEGEEREETLSVPGVTEGEPRCDGIFFTHTHGDHIGQLERIHPAIPLYLGKTARDLCLLLNGYIHAAGHDRQKTIDALRRAKPFEKAEKIHVGSLTVTPLLVDHSAFDAYMFLIEGEGKRVLYTGDFRGHGFRAKGLLPTIRAYARGVDYLVCEGTMLSRMGEKVKTEHELQRDAADLMRRYKRVFVVCSSMHIDRIAGFCHAIPKGDRRPILCDGYQQQIIDLIRAEYGDIRLYDLPKVYAVPPFPDSLKKWVEGEGFLWFIRPNDSGERALAEYGEGAVIAYSQWEGYLRGATENKKLSRMLEGRAYENLHTSGHATSQTLREVYDAAKPSRGIIPIHTERPEAFQTLFPGAAIHLLADGETMTL